MKTVTHYELAWIMYSAGNDIPTIEEAVGRTRATLYRWFARIKRLGIKEFVRRKQAAKRRRQPRRVVMSIRQLIRSIRRQYGWCGQKIRKQLWEVHGISLGLETVYRVLRDYFRLRKHHHKPRGQRVVAGGPRELIEHDTVDFGGLFAFTSIDVFTKEPVVVMATDLTMETGTRVFLTQKSYYGPAYCHQGDEGSEFQSLFADCVTATGSLHRYSRPYKKNDQAHIENFNKSLRSECLGWGSYAKADLARLQVKVDRYLKHWMDERWHMGLPDMMTPAQHLKWYAESSESM